MINKEWQEPEDIRLQNEYHRLFNQLGKVQDSLTSGTAVQQLMEDGSMKVGDVNLSELTRQVDEAKRLWDEAKQRGI